MPKVYFTHTEPISAEPKELKAIGVLESDSAKIFYIESRFLKFLKRTKSSIIKKYVYVPQESKDKIHTVLLEKGFTPYDDTYIKEYRNVWCRININYDFREVIQLELIISSPKNLENLLNKLKEELINSLGKIDITDKICIFWYSWVRDRIVSQSFVVKYDETFYPEAYPYLENVENIFDEYIKSQENVLILRGSPGTGKTRFIRWLLQHVGVLNVRMKNNDSMPTVTYIKDRILLMQDSFYAQLMSNYRNENSFLIVEDMDFDLGPRKEGNFAMPNLLSLSDGLIPFKMKCIFTTNLPGINHIDEALLRPGRLFKVIETRKLNPSEAAILIEKITGKKIIIKDNLSLAEIYKIAKEVRNERI